MTDFATLLKATRKVSDLTQKEAGQLFVPPIPSATWQRYEYGKTKPHPITQNAIIQKLKEYRP